jgi:hypothetical protein
VQLADLDRVIEVAGGFATRRSLRAYSPRTRREFVTLLAAEVRRPGWTGSSLPR